MLPNLIQYARDSWGLLPLLLLVFVLGLAVIIERLVFLHKSIKAGLSLEYDLQRVDKRNAAEAQQLSQHYEGTIQVELVKAALKIQGEPEIVFERDIEEAIMFQMPKLDRNLWLLDTCVTLGPLLGLLGTIVHMIEAFTVLSAHKGQSVVSVTGPIASALVATACGLVVAIVCVVFLNYFNKRIRLLINQMDLIKSMLVSRFATLVA